MFSFDDLNEIAKMFNCNKGQPNQHCKTDGNGNKECSASNGICPGSELSLTPSQLLVIAGFLAKVLEVNSVLISKDQVIQIVLTGSLKRPTQLDNVIKQIGQLPFETVLQSIVNNLS